MKAVALTLLLILIQGCSSTEYITKTEYITYPYGNSYLLQPIELEPYTGKTHRDILLRAHKLKSALEKCNLNSKAMSRILIKHNEAVKRK